MGSPLGCHEILNRIPGSSLPKPLLRDCQKAVTVQTPSATVPIYHYRICISEHDPLAGTHVQIQLIADNHFDNWQQPLCLVRAEHVETGQHWDIPCVSTRDGNLVAHWYPQLAGFYRICTSLTTNTTTIRVHPNLPDASKSSVQLLPPVPFPTYVRTAEVTLRDRSGNLCEKTSVEVSVTGALKVANVRNVTNGIMHVDLLITNESTPNVVRRAHFVTGHQEIVNGSPAEIQMSNTVTVGPTEALGACTGLNDCPLVRFGWTEENNPQVKDHIEQCPLVHVDGSTKSTLMQPAPTSDVMGNLWLNWKQAKARSNMWEGILDEEAANWQEMSTKFVDLTKQTLLGIVKELPVELNIVDVPKVQKRLKERRQLCKARKTDMIKRIQVLNKKQQALDQSRKLLIQLTVNEMNVKLTESEFAQNMILRHDYVTRTTNQERLLEERTTWNTRERLNLQKVETLKELALGRKPEPATPLSDTLIPAFDLTVTRTNAFDGAQVARGITDELLARDRGKVGVKNPPPDNKGSVALDFITGGFWRRDAADAARRRERREETALSPLQHIQRNHHESDLENNASASQQPANIFASRPWDGTDWYIKRDDGGYQKQKAARKSRWQEEPEVAPPMWLGRYEDAPLAVYPETDALPVERVLREAEEAKAKKERDAAVKRIRERKRKEREEEKERKAREALKFKAPPLPYSDQFLMPAGPPPAPRPYRRVVPDHLNLVDTSQQPNLFLDYLERPNPERYI